MSFHVVNLLVFLSFSVTCLIWQSIPESELSHPHAPTAAPTTHPFRLTRTLNGYDSQIYADVGITNDGQMILIAARDSENGQYRVYSIYHDTYTLLSTSTIEYIQVSNNVLVFMNYFHTKIHTYTCMTTCVLEAVTDAKVTGDYVQLNGESSLSGDALTLASFGYNFQSDVEDRYNVLIYRRTVGEGFIFNEEIALLTKLNLGLQLEMNVDGTILAVTQTEGIYIFKYSQGSWQQQTHLITFSNSRNYRFSFSPDGTLGVGLSNMDNGTVTLYKEVEDGVWSSQPIVPSILGSYANYGGGLFLQDDLLVVSATNDDYYDTEDDSPGSLFIFHHVGEEWIETRIENEDSTTYYGRPPLVVSQDGRTIAMTARNNSIHARILVFT